ncbi:MAG: hypothetical protein RIQ93_305 [Verrucomicrobiota bacterium]
MKRLSQFLLLAACLPFLNTTSAAPADRPLRALLVIGGCCHDYAAQKDILKQGLEARVNLIVDIAYASSTTVETRFPLYEKSGWATGYDVVIHDECSADVRDRAYIENILAPHRAGLPAVNLHCAMHSYRLGADDWFEFCGIQSSRHGPKLPIAVTLAAAGHPILQGIPGWTTGNEELYNNVRLFPNTTPLMSGLQKTPKGDDTAVVTWTNLYRNQTRVFSTTLGHMNATVADPNYLNLVARGLLWACDKLNADYLKQPLTARP